MDDVRERIYEVVGAFKNSRTRDKAADILEAVLEVAAKEKGRVLISFRAELPVDDATWARGRGWALSFGLIALPYYRDTNPVLAGIARRAIDEAVADRECQA